MALQVSRPMSVKEIVAKAKDYDFNPNIALKYWLRTADSLLRESEIYLAEGNDQQAYLLLMRWVTLVADQLPGHPEAKLRENKPALKLTHRHLKEVVERLEFLKPRINSRYETWCARRESLASLGSAQNGSYSRTSDDMGDSDPAIAGKRQTLAAAEHGDLAVQLAHKEIRRRDAARRATRQAGISEAEEHERRTAGLWDNWETALTKDKRSDDDEQRRRMEDARRRLEGDRRSQDIARIQEPKLLSKLPPYSSRPTSEQILDFRYPSINKSQSYSYTDSPPGTRPYITESVPPRPKKESLYSPSAPVVPSKSPLLPPYESKDSVLSGQPPEQDTDNDAKAFTFRPSAYLENGSPLRTLFLPPTLRERFLQIASANTRANLETCGILCGTLISNALFISKLVIPEQEATSDTCDTVNEGALFEYCDKEDLMVLGWIHTHPSQTCFLSSRDLHTHSGYQVMMPESIAIVCAPSKNPSWGVFRLTDPPGMKTVLNCRQTGLFHPHGEADIYTDALRPGHVFEATGLKFEVVDLRPGYQ